MDHYTARKRNALQPHTLIWIHLRNIILKEKANHRRINMVWLHLYKVEKHAKPVQTHVIKSQSKARGCLRQHSVSSTREGHSRDFKGNSIHFLNGGGGCCFSSFYKYFLVSFHYKKNQQEKIFWRVRGKAVEETEVCQCLCTAQSDKYTKFLTELKTSNRGLPWWRSG